MTFHYIGIIAESISMSWIWRSAELYIHTPYPCPYLEIIKCILYFQEIEDRDLKWNVIT